MSYLYIGFVLGGLETGGFAKGHPFYYSILLTFDSKRNFYLNTDVAAHIAHAYIFNKG